MTHLNGKAPTSGKYTIAIAYKAIMEEDRDKVDWTWLWKIKAPHKLKSFLLLVMHEKLLTNHMRLIRNLSNSELCPRC